jgi:hypothetical protein
MPLDDFDLEFEDEGEEKKPETSAKEANLPFSPEKPKPRLVENGPAASVTNTQIVRPVATNPSITRPVNAQTDDTSEHLRKVEFEAAVQAQVADFKIDLLVELLSDIKLMEHRIGQLLSRIHAKHPDIKNEALMIKKLLADFTQKKRK